MHVLHLVASAAVIAGFGAVVAPSSEEAIAPMCRGRAATIVGDPSVEVLRGTPKGDVIVTNGSLRTESYQGNDVICVTGTGDAYTTVNAGRGSDKVFNQQSAAYVQAVLGRGFSETYVGGDNGDRVRASGQTRGLIRIETGAGPDAIEFGRAAPLRVEIALGAGQDALSMRLSPSTRGIVDGCSADGGLVVSISISANAEVGRGTRVVVDNGSGVTIGANKSITLADFEVVDASYLEQVRLTMLGGSASELLYVPEGRLLQRVDGRGGDDVVRLGAETRVSGSISGGDGADVLDMSRSGASRDNRVVGDLGLGRIRVMPINGDGASHDIKFGEFEAVGIDAFEAGLIGTANDETLSVGACRGFINGRGGDDALIDGAFGDEGDGSNVSDCRRSIEARMHGGRGDDILTGSEFSDTLIGGKGMDTADGQGGNDTCQAEVMINCTASTGLLKALP